MDISSVFGSINFEQLDLTQTFCLYPSTNFSQQFDEILAHSSSENVCNWVRFVVYFSHTRFFRSAYKFSLGLWSGLCVGHCRVSKYRTSKFVLVMLKMWKRYIKEWLNECQCVCQFSWTSLINMSHFSFKTDQRLFVTHTLPLNWLIYVTWCYVFEAKKQAWNDHPTKLAFVEWETFNLSSQHPTRSFSTLYLVGFEQHNQTPANSKWQQTVTYSHDPYVISVAARGH